MSIPQALPSVQGLSGLSAWRGNGSLPFTPPVSQPLVPGSPAVWPSWVPRDVWQPMGNTSLPVMAGSLGAAPVVQVNGIWLFQETVQTWERTPWSQSPLDIARVGVQQGLGRVRELPQGLLTQHALMVAWGEFAHEIGLIPRLQQVPMSQKSVVHTPQAKVLTFLMGILTGITHLKDLNEGPHPLAHDWPAIRAWGLASLAHYSGVSRTLASCDEATVEAITQVLHEVSRPFIEQEVRLLRERNLPLVLDLDLAPRRVSNTSTTFPDAQWTRVGSNAEMIAWDEQYINHCPYPLTMALERFHTPNGLKHSTLITYRGDGQHLILPAWFDFYNARQTIEAGIKEVNVVFKMHPLKMRSRGGLALQE